MSNKTFTGRFEESFSSTTKIGLATKLRVNFDYSLRTPTTGVEKHNIFLSASGDKMSGYGVLNPQQAKALADHLLALVKQGKEEQEEFDKPAYYPAGTVAKATVMGVPNVTVLRRETIAGNDWAFSPDAKRGIKYSCAADSEGIVKDIVVVDI